MRFADAMEQYGTDKPDLRYGMPLVDVTLAMSAGNSGDASVTVAGPLFARDLATGGRVLALRAERAAATMTRKAVQALQADAAGLGAKVGRNSAWTSDFLEGSVQPMRTEDGVRYECVGS